MTDPCGGRGPSPQRSEDPPTPLSPADRLVLASMAARIEAEAALGSATSDTADGLHIVWVHDPGGDGDWFCGPYLGVTAALTAVDRVTAILHTGMPADEAPFTVTAQPLLREGHLR